jgi:hypothetical protein
MGTVKLSFSIFQLHNLNGAETSNVRLGSVVVGAAGAIKQMLEIRVEAGDEHANNKGVWDRCLPLRWLLTFGRRDPSAYDRLPTRRKLPAGAQDLREF